MQNETRIPRISHFPHTHILHAIVQLLLLPCSCSPSLCTCPDCPLCLPSSATAAPPQVLEKAYFMVPDEDGVLEKATGTKIEWNTGQGSCWQVVMAMGTG